MSTEGSAAVVDTHVHLWDIESTWYPWLGPEQGVAYDTFTASELAQALAEATVDRAVLVEAASTVAETEQLLRIAAASPVVAGVVGWVDIGRPDVEEVLAALQEGEGGTYLRGVRVQLAPDGSPRVGSIELVRGGGAVAASGLVLDILTTWACLPDVAALAREVPHAQFVLDHFAYPDDDRAQAAAWRDALGVLAPLANVALKVSAVSPAKRDDAAFAIELLGLERMIFGSDWPLCLRYGSYAQAVALARELVEPGWHEHVFGQNARQIYRLDTRLK